MSVTSLIAQNYTGLHKALIFFLRLAWKSRIRLPYLIMIGFMVLDVRVTLEIIVDVENHIPPNNDLSSVESSNEDSDE
ncbi:hypothetical protein RUM44_011079 [Polyplax serrata]|uniref:Uncharacterized protein n=1 Tax=Polyplax serrata TaxID=468196 RepID=A0ABR1ANZ4_POLSC